MRLDRPREGVIAVTPLLSESVGSSCCTTTTEAAVALVADEAPALPDHRMWGKHLPCSQPILHPFLP